MQDAMSDHQVNVFNIISDFKKTLDPRYACTGFEGSVDSESHTAHVQLVIYSAEGSPNHEIEKKYRKLNKKIREYFSAHSLTLELEIKVSDFPLSHVNTADYDHFIACIEKILIYPDSLIHQQKKEALIKWLKFIRPTTQTSNTSDLSNLCVEGLYSILWPTLADLCVSNNREYKITNDFFYSLMKYGTSIDRNTKKTLLDYLTRQKEYDIIEDGQQLNIVTLKITRGKFPELELNIRALFDVTNQNEGQIRDINRIEKYKRALSLLLELFRKRLNKAEENLREASIYTNAHRNCQRFFQELSSEQIIGILGMDFKATYNAFIENQGDRYKKTLDECENIYEKYKSLVQKISFLISIYNKNIMEIKAEERKPDAETSYGTLFKSRSKTPPAENEAADQASSHLPITEIVVAGPSNFTKECKDKAKEQEARNKSTAPTTTQKPVSAEDPKENARDTPPIVLIRMDGREDILLNLNSGKDAQGRDIAYHVAPSLIDACYLLLTEGPYVIDERNQNAIVNSSGRDFLKKSGKGSNGPKLFAEDLIGIKKADENNRLILAGIEITVLDKKYKLYFPVDNLDHGTWERRQSRSPETMDYRARMVTQVSQISLTAQIVGRDGNSRPRPSFSM